MGSFGDQLKRFLRKLACDPSQPTPPARTEPKTPFEGKPEVQVNTTPPPPPQVDRPTHEPIDDDTALPADLDDAVGQLLEQQHDVAVRVDRIADHIEQQTARMDELARQLGQATTRGAEQENLADAVERVQRSVDAAATSLHDMEKRLAGREQALATIRDNVTEAQQTLTRHAQSLDRIDARLGELAQQDTGALEGMQSMIQTMQQRLEMISKEAAQPARAAAQVGYVAVVASLLTLAAVIYLLAQAL